MMNQEEKLDLVFKALGDSTRRKILAMLAKDEIRVTDIAEPFNMSLNAVSKHLMVLEKAGLLVRTKDGRIHRCKMDPKPLEPALEAIQYYKSFWEGQLDGLENYLEQRLKEREKQK
jgi:DNA-binding transcriptional ArsR family regulator